MPAPDAAELEKRARALKKKLGQIQNLKEKDDADLDASAREKMASEASILKELAEIDQELGGSSKPAPAPAQAAPKPAAKPEAKPAAKPAAAPAPAPAPAPALAAEDEEGPPPAEAEKRIKALKKKLQQIEKLKNRGGDLDAEARQKVASEAEILREIDCLEKGEIYVPPVGAEPEAQAPEEPAVNDDPQAAERAEALEPFADLGLLIDDEAEKKFRAAQKKLRDISKLREKDKLDKLQQDKLTAEPGLIIEIQELRAQGKEILAQRRARHEEVQRQPVPVLVKKKDFAPTGRAGAAAPGEDEVEEEEEKVEVDKSKAKDSADLKTNRQKKAAEAAPKKRFEESSVSAAVAVWPEVKEVAASGEGGTDKGRQKTGITVDRPKLEPPYGTFDSALLKCNFLSRVELRVPPGVLRQDTFMLGFPGNLRESLVELILKDNDLTAIPPGIEDLKRIRSMDLSGNQIASLPIAEVWEALSGTLELLDLSRNQIGSIANLVPLTKLSSLKMDTNKLTSLEGVAWKDLKQLSTLSAFGNEIEELPEEISERAESLEHVELSGNKITVVPNGIVELKKLKTLAMGGNPIKDPKVVRYLEGGGKGIKDLKAYLTKNAGKKR